MNPISLRLSLSAPLAFALAALGGCSRDPDAKTAALPPVPVQVATALQQDVPRAIESIGSVQSLRTVAIKSQVDGIIAEFHFREGDDVKAGDLLVTLDRRPFENGLRIARADLVNARAEAAAAEADAERYTHLDQKDAISKEQLTQILTKAETTKAQVLSKEAAVANAELLLGYAEIRAPIAGRTGQLMLHEGALVKANDSGSSIVTINQLSPVAVAYAVPESSLDEIRAAVAAQRVNVAVSERTSGLKRDNGRLEFVDNTVDNATGMIMLKAVFANEDYALWPGRFVNVRTEVGVDRNAIVVPATAVQTSQSGSAIYVLKPDRTVELRTVKLVRTAGDSVLVAEGIKAGETVVTDGQLRLVPGARAEPTNLAAAPAAAPGTQKSGKT
jgi:multidrug efflux system membrane fusion protein